MAMASSSRTTALRRVSVLLAGSGVYVSSAYLFYHYNYQRKQVMAVTEVHSSTDASAGADGTSSCGCCAGRSILLDSAARQGRFQALADHYDNCIGWDEFFMGINWLRRMLLFFHARGTCLEVGAGTGRNLPYYPTSRVDRVLFTDVSDQMLDQTKQKIQKLGRPSEAAPWHSRFAVLQRDAADLKLPDQAFDTVVDTFGLCSYDDPVAVLKELARVCKTHGKILLLEHGRSKTWALVTQHLDRNVETHAANWGCVWNKDIDDILQQSGLMVEVLSKYHFGTTYYVVCRPSSSLTAAPRI